MFTLGLISAWDYEREIPNQETNSEQLRANLAENYYPTEVKHTHIHAHTDTHVHRHAFKCTYIVY